MEVTLKSICGPNFRLTEKNNASQAGLFVNNQHLKSTFLALATMAEVARKNLGLFPLTVRHLDFAVYFFNIYSLGVIPNQMFTEVVSPQPEEILIQVAISMPLAGEEKEIETFIGSDQGISQPDRVGRMDIVIDITCDY